MSVTEPTVTVTGTAGVMSPRAGTQADRARRAGPPAQACHMAAAGAQAERAPRGADRAGPIRVRVPGRVLPAPAQALQVTVHTGVKFTVYRASGEGLSPA